MMNVTAQAGLPSNCQCIGMQPCNGRFQVYQRFEMSTSSIIFLVLVSVLALSYCWGAKRASTYTWPTILRVEYTEAGDEQLEEFT